MPRARRRRRPISRRLKPSSPESAARSMDCERSSTRSSRANCSSTSEVIEAKVLVPSPCIGDWMGSHYDVGGRRYDYHLFLNHDGRYERTLRKEPDYERRDTG